MAPKGVLVGLPGYPTKQFRTHLHGPCTRPRQPRPHSLTTPQSGRRAASASRAEPSVAGLGLQPGERALRAEAALPVAPSPAGLAGPSAGRTKRGALPLAAVPTTSGPRPQHLPLLPPRAILFFSWTPSCPARRPSPPRGQGACRFHDASRRARQTPREARMGLDSRTYIFPPPRLPPALLSR